MWCVSLLVGHMKSVETGGPLTAIDILAATFAVSLSIIKYVSNCVIWFVTLFWMGVLVSFVLN